MTNRTIDNEPSDYSPSDFDPREEAPQVRLSSWLPIDLEPVFRGEYSAPVPTVLERNDGVFVFYSSAVNSLVGESGSCKTWVALIAIEQELHLGHHVMLIDYEGDRQSIVNRLRELGITDDQMRGRFSYVQPDRKFTDTDQARVFEECIEERGVPSLVIIDGLTEAFAQAGLNPNEGVDVANYFAGAPKWFAHQGAAVVLIDHVTKNAESRNGYAIGSQHKKSAITGAMYVVEVVTAFGRSKT